MSKKYFNMVFPQWQGIGLKGPFRGANMINENYLMGSEWTNVPIVGGDELRVEKGIIGYQEVLEQLDSVTRILKDNRPDRLITVGGDCGIELGPVSYLNQRYDGDLALIWFDAHGDLNTPDSSPSQRFHGMPVRCLLGEGDDQIVKRCFSRLELDQIVLAGTRDLDPPEERFIKDESISVADQITSGGEELIRMLKTKGYSNVHLHVDLDVLDCAGFPHVTCPVPGGPNMKNLVEVVKEVAGEFNVVGFSLLEFAPQHHQAALEIKDIMDLMGMISEDRIKKVCRAS